MNKIIYNCRTINNPDDGSMFEANVIKHEMNDTRLELRYFEGDSRWCKPYRGSVAAKLKDNGDGVKISFGKKKVKLDYCQVEEMYLLLKYHFDDSDTEVVKTEVVTMKPICCGCEES